METGAFGFSRKHCRYNASRNGPIFLTRTLRLQTESLLNPDINLLLGQS